MPSLPSLTAYIIAHIALGVSRLLVTSGDNFQGSLRISLGTEKLGLNAATAAKLYTGELDPHIVSQLLESPYCSQLVEQLKALEDGTASAVLGADRQIPSIIGRLLRKQGKARPSDRMATKLALKDLRSHAIPPMLSDMVMILATFEALLTDLMRQADAHVNDQTKLTSNIMGNVIRHLERRQHSFDLKQITIDDLTDAIVEPVEEVGYPANQQDRLREHLLDLFNHCVSTWKTRRICLLTEKVHTKCLKLWYAPA